jgi:DNA-binding FadR family transcriptional regulator
VASAYHVTISGRLRSEAVTRHRYAIRGYLSTAAKHGISVFTAILAALTGRDSDRARTRMAAHLFTVEDYWER